MQGSLCSSVLDSVLVLWRHGRQHLGQLMHHASSLRTVPSAPCVVGQTMRHQFWLPKIAALHPTLLSLKDIVELKIDSLHCTA
jgi:hypothetical protein